MERRGKDVATAALDYSVSVYGAGPATEKSKIREKFVHKGSAALCS
jgi:hypothetical protein